MAVYDVKLRLVVTLRLGTVFRKSRRLPLILAAVALLATAAFPSLKVGAQECRADPYPGVNWAGCGKRNLMLSGSDFTKAKLGDADLSFTDLRNSALDGADFTKAKLMRASLANSKAKDANFSKTEAYRGDFQKLMAPDADFSGAELQRANFTGADLTSVSFEKAELSRAQFSKSTLTGADFIYANLARADLTGTVFKGPLRFDNAFLFLTRIEGLDLSTSTGLDQHQLGMACGDDKTKLPPGLFRPEDWPCNNDDND